MPDRRPIRQAHERAQVSIFLAWLNSRYKAKYSVVQEPDPLPPDAIVRSGRTTRWVEVTDAFMSDAFAKDEYSFATPGEAHKPMGSGPFINPDAAFADRFVGVVKNKLEKTSYLEIRDSYGPGYLVVPIMYPLFNSHTLYFLRTAWNRAEVEDLGCFRSVYMTMNMGRGPVQRWNMYRRS